jgi:hypothetical protein
MELDPTITVVGVQLSNKVHYSKVVVGSSTERMLGHRLVLTSFFGPPLDVHHQDCMHLCGMELCINPIHLWWGSHKENMALRDAVEGSMVHQQLMLKHMQDREAHMLQLGLWQVPLMPSVPKGKKGKKGK